MIKSHDWLIQLYSTVLCPLSKLESHGCTHLKYTQDLPTGYIGVTQLKYTQHLITGNIGITCCLCSQYVYNVSSGYVSSVRDTFLPPPCPATVREEIAMAEINELQLPDYGGGEITEY